MKTADKERRSKDTGDFFELVECQDVLVKQPDGQFNTTIQVKISTSGKGSHIMSYNLDKDREVTWLSASRDAKIFFGHSAQGTACYVYDSEFGVINLHSKEIQYEFHTLDKNRNALHLDYVKYGVQWGSRLVQLDDKCLMIFANTMLLPYSYLNLIQRFRSISQDLERKVFFVEDYCLIGHQNSLHKFRLDPALLEKILDCYWDQNPLYVLSVLVNEVNKNVQRMETGSRQKTVRGSAQRRVESDGGMDILETQISISSYRLINKILLFLSKLPPQLSFYDLMPKFKDMTNFTFFDNYMATWLDQTSQMEATQVLFTSLQKGRHRVVKNSSYLDRTFFNDFPKHLISKDALEELNDKAMSRKFRNAHMHQVRINMVQVSWIKDWDTSVHFFEALVNQSNLALFKNRTIVELIGYMWDICKVYFIWYRFFPFVVFFYVPISAFIFIPAEDQHNVLNGFQLACLALTSLYLLYQLFGQLRDMCKLGLRGYCSDFTSIFNLAIVVVLTAFIFYSAQIVLHVLRREG